MRFLLINPWIYDFSAFDLWAKPLGLLYLASLLRQSGAEVFLVDCLDRYHWSLRNKPVKENEFGCGKYSVTEIPKPAPLKFIPRRYKRYGISPEAFITDLNKIGKPDAILITSRMTYWYPAVVEVIRICRQIFPATPVILGGTYATLMPEHARQLSGADVICTGEGEEQIFSIISKVTGIQLENLPICLADLDTLPPPAYDLYEHNSYLVVQASRGCPYHCSYCAARILSPAFRRRQPERVAEELIYFEQKFKIRDIAFYDEALLFEPEKYFIPLIEKYLCLGGKARFHTPNGLDPLEIDNDLARMMKRANFLTIRLSLETANPEQLRHLNRRRESLEGFKRAMSALKSAGFTHREIGVYLMAGLPGQTLEEVKNNIEIVLNLGGTPRLVEYSPIPGTALWEEAIAAVKPLDIASEPLYHNNSVYYRLLPEFKTDPFPALRNYIADRLSNR